MMSEPMTTEWRRAEYVAEDGQVIALISPAGLIPPPVIDLHQPETGAVRFVYAGSKDAR